MRKILVFSLCLSMLLGLALTASAQTVEGMMYGVYSVDGTTLNCYGMPLPKSSELSVSCSGTEVEDISISTLWDSSVPVTYFVVADASSSLSGNQKKQQKDALLTISKKLRAGDSMVLALMGDQLKVSSPLTTPEERDAAINANWVLAYSTDLYSNLYDAISMSQDKTAYPGVTCLIVLTDGIDDKNNRSVDDVKAALRASNAPIHVLALIDMFPDTYAKNKVAVLTGIAEVTAGSSACAPGMDNASMSDAAAQVVDTMVSSCVLGLDTNQLQRIGGAASISFRCTTAENTYEGTLSVPEYLLPERVLPTEPETIPPETTEPVTIPPVTEPAPSNALLTIVNLKQPLILAAIGVLALVIAVILMIFFVRRNSRRRDQQEEPEEEAFEQETFTSTRAARNQFDFNGFDAIAERKSSKEPAFTPAASEVKETEKAEPAAETAAPEYNFFQTNEACIVNLVEVENGDIRVSAGIEVNSYKTFGRTEKANVLLNGADPTLASVHFALYWDGTYLFVQDLGKGIYLNAEKQKTGEWIHIPSGSNLTAGDCTYRVYLT